MIIVWVSVFWWFKFWFWLIFVSLNLFGWLVSWCLLCVCWYCLVGVGCVVVVLDCCWVVGRWFYCVIGC